MFRAIKYFCKDLKNAWTGNYTVNTTRTAGIKPHPYSIVYTEEEMAEMWKRGLAKDGDKNE